MPVAAVLMLNTEHTRCLHCLAYICDLVCILDKAFALLVVQIADHHRSVLAECHPGAAPDILQRLLDDDQQLFGVMRRII